MVRSYIKGQHLALMLSTWAVILESLPHVHLRGNRHLTTWCRFRVPLHVTALLLSWISWRPGMIRNRAAQTKNVGNCHLSNHSKRKKETRARTRVRASNDTRKLGRARLGGSPTPPLCAGLILFLVASLKILVKKKHNKIAFYFVSCIFFLTFSNSQNLLARGR
jgi:hypothetical protein